MDHRLISVGMLELASYEAPETGVVGRIVLPWFRKDTTVDVIFELEVASNSPNDLQVQAFTEFASSKYNIFTQVEKRVWDYYQRSVACHEGSLVISNSQSLAEKTTLTGCVVGYFDGDDWSAYIGLLAECEWEPEHGLGIKIVDGLISEIGFQDIIT